MCIEYQFTGGITLSPACALVNNNTCSPCPLIVYNPHQEAISINSRFSKKQTMKTKKETKKTKKRDGKV